MARSNICADVKHASRRRRDGNQMAELGPGLLILLLSTFFPLVLLINLAITYGSGYMLNNLQIREAAVNKKSEATDPNGNVMKNIPTNWKTMGVGRYCSLVNDPQTSVGYKDGSTSDGGSTDKIVIVTTTIQTKPMLEGMNFADIPGLTTPATWNYQSEAVIENADDFNK